MKKILLFLVIIVSSLFLGGGTVFAEIDNPCHLTGLNSTCTENQTIVQISSNFVNGVINGGLDFNLVAGSLQVRLDEAANTFTISNAAGIYFEDNAPAINNSSLEISLSADRKDKSFIDLNDTNINQVKSISLEASPANQGTVVVNNVLAKDSITIRAGKIVRFREDIWVTEPQPDILSLPAKEITLEAGELILGGNYSNGWQGGDIINQPNINTQTGNGGNIFLQAPQIITGNILAAGYGANGEFGSTGMGGDVTIYGENIVTGTINTESIRGSLYDPNLGESWENSNFDSVFGLAGTITIRKSVADEWINYFRSDDIITRGVTPTDISIKADKSVWVKEIKAYSGCASVVLEACDYANIDCQEDPYASGPKSRHYCSNFNPSGSVEITANGTTHVNPMNNNWAAAEGIRIEKGIYNHAFCLGQSPFSLPENDFHWEGSCNMKVHGAGEVGEVKLEAPDGLVYIGTGYWGLPDGNGSSVPSAASLYSIGFHNHGVEDALSITANYFRIDSAIVTENPAVAVLPADIVSGVGMGAGDISITAEHGGDGTVLLGGYYIYTNSYYPFAKKGGNVNITADGRADGVKKEFSFTTRLEIKANGWSYDDEDVYDLWFVRDGLSINPYSNFPIDPSVFFDPSGWCSADSNREYYYGTDGEDGFEGGNGGDISISAPRIWDNCGEGNLYVYTNGGDGSRGGIGGEANFCVYSYEGTHNAISPYGGSGGKGGKGGNGGSVTMSTGGPGIHCFSSFKIESQGGNGGVTGLSRDPWRDPNEWAGNCNMTGFGSGLVAEKPQPKNPGSGGDGGYIDISTAPTDGSVTSANMKTSGGKGAYARDNATHPYPHFCIYQRSATEVFDDIREVQLCKEQVNERLGLIAGAYGSCEEPSSPDVYTCAEYCSNIGQGIPSPCFTDCLNNWAKALAECEFEGGVNEASGPNGTFEDGYSGDPRCCTYKNACHGYSAYDPEEGVCYTQEEYAANCRSRVSRITPCQDAGLTALEHPNNIPDNSILRVTQSVETAFSGQKGGSGGNAGQITFDSPISGGSSFDFYLGGGDAGWGGDAQDSYTVKAGRGGDGGDGGNVGELYVTNSNVDMRADPGEGENAGERGYRQAIELPRANSTDNICWTESDPVSVHNLEFGNIDGEEGSDGSQGNSDPGGDSTKHLISEAAVGVGLSCGDDSLDDEDPPDPGLGEDNCCDGVDDDGDGFTDCQDIGCFEDCYTNNTNKGYLIKTGFDTKMPNPIVEEGNACGVEICQDVWDNDENNDGIDFADNTECALDVDINTPPVVSPKEPSVTRACFTNFFNVLFSWDYSDLDNVPPGTDPQSAYEIKVNGNGGIDITGTGDQEQHGTQDLLFDEPYTWEIRVQDERGAWSDWVEGPNISPVFKPPEPDFNIDIINEITFTFENTSDCFDPSCSYDWLFVNASSTSPTDITGVGKDIDPEVVFSENMNFPSPPSSITLNKIAKLTATDGSGFSCTVGAGEEGAISPPDWTEISPF